jgi:putative FmdB family regulatory protein
MPTYAYQCSDCSHTSDVFQKISDDPLTMCPSCGKDTFKRAIAGASVTFSFKGSGFYQTDYKNTQSGACCPCGKNNKSCG